MLPSGPIITLNMNEGFTMAAACSMSSCTGFPIMFPEHISSLTPLPRPSFKESEWFFDIVSKEAIPGRIDFFPPAQPTRK